MNDNYPEGLVINAETLPFIAKLGEMLPGGFFFYHAFGDQELIGFNSKMLDLFGCSDEQEFRDLVGNSFKGIVHPEEYEAVESSIRSQIAASSDNMDHVKYRFIRKDGSVGMMDDYGHFSHSGTFGDIYYVFVQDISEQYSEEQQRRNEVIEAFAGSESTYIGYPETDRFEILSQNEYLKRRYKPNETFSESIARYIRNDVYAPDRESATREIVLREIAESIDKGKTFHFRYRDISSGSPRWYEMKAARLSDREILYSFTDIDDSLTEQILYQKFQENYFGLYYINLNTGFAKILRTAHPEMTGESGTVRRYVDLMHDIASASRGETYDFLHQISDVEYIKDRFRSDDLAFYTYKSHVFDGERWVSVTGRVLTRDAEGTPNLFAIGFSLMDVKSSEIEAAKSEALQLEFDKLVEIASLTYKNVYIVDTYDNSVDVRKMDPSMIGHGYTFENFSGIREFFLNDVVHPRDRERMRRELDFEVIKRKLAQTSSYDVEYNVLKNGATLWSEMNVKSGSGGRIIIAMAEHDLEIGKRRLEEKRFGEYMALYTVDVDEQSIRPLKINELYHTITEGGVGPYKEVLQKFASIYSGEVREFFLRISDLKNISDIFANSDKFTYSFKAVNASGDLWIEMVSYVLVRHDDGSPAVFTMGFTASDEFASHTYEDQSRIKTDMQMISGLAGEYYALYYLNIAEKIFKIYTLDMERFPQAAGIVAAGGDPMEMLRRFGTSELVHPDDRAAFASIDESFIQEKLAHSKKFSIRFRRIFDGRYRWAEMDVIKYGDYDEPANVVAIGFAERDSAIRSEEALRGIYDILAIGRSAEESISGLLSLGGDFYGAERCYVFELRKGGATLDNTYEWCAPGIEPMLDKLQDVPYEVCAGWFDEFIRQGAFYMNALDSEHNTPETVAILQMQGIDSLVAAPLLSGDKIVGFIGVDNPRLSNGDLNVMRTIAAVSYSEILKRNEMQREVAAIRDLADQQRRIKSFGDMINAALWDMTVGSDGTIKKVNWSNEVRRMFGYEETREDFPNVLESWSDILHPDDKKRVLDVLQRGLKDTSDTSDFVYDTEYRVRRKSGEYRWYHAAGRMEDIEDREKRLYGIVVDITADKDLAEALSMAESASRAKTTFLNNMSHDIRTPMNAIIGYTGLAASHIENRLQVQGYLAKIAQSSEHLLSLINDVLDMSRIESGKMNLDEKPENLPDIIHTLRDIVQADIHSKQHDFYIDTVNVYDERILCDKLRLNQMLLNILSNSIKYTAPGGTISMRIVQKAVKPSGYATYEFRIKDNGVGMSPEYLETIFDPFTRAKSSTVSGIQGTGLGMAITKNIIDMMGGTIGIQSEPGKGTETVVTLDFKLQEAHKENMSIPEFAGMRALVADDDANTCVSIEKMLKDIGMRSEWCTSGKEAVFRAQNAYRSGDWFKVYIIDWLMPDMNGIETVRRIRAVIGDDAPIIILTAYDWSDIEEEARLAGVTAFVSKPMFPSDLGRVLRSCLGINPEAYGSPEPSYDFKGRKILLVEDNELNLEIAQTILEEEGFIVDTASDGTIAVEKMSAAQSGDYDLILMDVQMQEMDGYEATRRIRAMGTEISRIPILAMTANAFEEDRRAALESGMNEHIAKPIDVAKLMDTLSRFL